MILLLTKLYCTTLGRGKNNVLIFFRKPIVNGPIKEEPEIEMTDASDNEL